MIKKISYSDASFTSENERKLSWLHINEFKTSSEELFADYVAFKLFPFSLEKRLINTPCHSVGKSNNNITTLIFPCSTPPVFFNDKLYSDNCPLIIPANTQINLYTRENFSARLVHIDNQGLRMILGEKIATTLIANLEHSDALQKNAKELENFAHILDKQIAYLESNPDKLEDEDAAKNVIETIVLGLGKFGVNSENTTPVIATEKPTTRTRHFQLLIQVMELILTDNESQLTIAKLAEAGSVSIRTLEYIFKDIIGLSPKEYMIAIRLNKVHNELKQPNNSDKLIRDIIHNYGVINTGRFAKEYRLFFGESPSKTLKKARNTSVLQPLSSSETIAQ